MKALKAIPAPLLKPNTSTRAFSCKKASEFLTPTPKDIKITALQPDDPSDFKAFKKIITNERIVFTSSWIDKWFGIKSLLQECSRTETKLKFIDEGDIDISMQKKFINAYKKGISPTQIALDRFFLMPSSEEMLRKVYLQMTARSQETGLGYYKFQNGSKLLGGGALAPISDGNPVEKVDIALHILLPKRGIGSLCLNLLLQEAFDARKVDQVWGSSIINHPGTPTLCSRHGMMIKDHGGMKYYFIDKEMWKANEGKMKLMENPIAASTHYKR